MGEISNSNDISIFIVGAGVVGSALIDQIVAYIEGQSQRLPPKPITLKIRGLATSKWMISPLKENIVSKPNSSRKSIWDCFGKDEVVPLNLSTFVTKSPQAATVVVDCTSSAQVSSMYERWLKLGCHVVTANKKANSGPFDYYTSLRSAGADNCVKFLYEANVGAGLPIISTMSDMVRTGDRFLGVEGILSGTLSYIFNAFDGSLPFSAVVKRAKELGYTEPDCREDLNGLDVARKVVIIAREIGIPVELESVKVKSLVPIELAGDNVDPDQFLERLPSADGELTKLASEAKDAGELLRYVGYIRRSDDKWECGVDLKRYSLEHPFGRLKGSDNIISLRTSRYDTQPMVIQGPGAGAEVTAAGVFGDILRVAG